MTTPPLHILSLSYGRNLFDVQNAESKRMQRGAARFSAMHTIIGTRSSENHVKTTVGNLHLHPTRSTNAVMIFFDILRIGHTLLREKKAWVITAQDPFELGFAGLLLAWWHRVPLNVQEHGDFYSRPFWRRDRLGNRVRWLIGIWVLRNADTVRVVSDRIQQAVTALGVRTERVIKLAVRTDAFDVAPSTPTTIAPDFGDARVVLTMARLVPQKNLPLLIDAFSIARKVVPNALLVIVGSGPLLLQLSHRVRMCGIEDVVRFVPWTDTPHVYLQKADVYALSSDWEGWARVLIEAMHEGVPIVTTDVGCANEVLKDGVHGFVVAPRDVQAFATALTRLLKNDTERTRLGEASRNDVALHHIDAEAYAEAQARVLEATYQIAQIRA